MAKNILTQSNDIINYDNLIAVSVEICPIDYAEDRVVDEPCIVAMDVNADKQFFSIPRTKMRSVRQ